MIVTVSSVTNSFIIFLDAPKLAAVSTIWLETFDFFSFPILSGGGVAGKLMLVVIAVNHSS
eukprot:TRINITY_DN81527_c0_g1_i2.p3 TRINITY_DN81527_c0_g1~~TRINITY_DN81527_c0_g1_i2.p3  ORF type:complete len:61 (-),score=5.56 TRINITY_DN81527_c0_g1_i2:324-506(-)